MMYWFCYLNASDPKKLGDPQVTALGRMFQNCHSAGPNGGRSTYRPLSSSQDRAKRLSNTAAMRKAMRLRAGRWRS